MANFSQVFEKILWRLELFDKVQGPLRTFLNRLRSGANFFGEFVADVATSCGSRKFPHDLHFFAKPEKPTLYGKTLCFPLQGRFSGKYRHPGRGTGTKVIRNDQFCYWPTFPWKSQQVRNVSKSSWRAPELFQGFKQLHARF